MPYKLTGRANGRPRGARTELSAEQRAALAVEFEMGGFRLSGEFAWPSAALVAERVGVTRRAVQKWRQADIYAAALVNLIADRAAAEMDRRDAEQAALDALTDPDDHDRVRAMTPIEYRRYVRHFVRQGWPGHPFRSQLDGRLYTSQKSYADHLIEAKAIPATEWPRRRR